MLHLIKHFAHKTENLLSGLIINLCVSACKICAKISDAKVNQYNLYHCFSGKIFRLAFFLLSQFMGINARQIIISHNYYGGAQAGIFLLESQYLLKLKNAFNVNNTVLLDLLF